MFRARASRAAWRGAIVTLFLLTTVIPASAASPQIMVDSSASPAGVTVGKVIAYVIDVTNMSTNTLNFVSLEGEFTPTSPSFTYLGASPANACSATVAFCDFGQLAGGVSPPQVTFYYQAPATQGLFDFTAVATVGEGSNDNPGAAHTDEFTKLVPTTVWEIQDDFVQGHAFGTNRTFSTGLTTLTTGNPHGTQVVIPSATTEVTVEDLDPGHPDAQCPPILTTCFGDGSSLSVGDGGPIPGGIQVTMRWDYSELPSGMTAQKLRIAHLLSATTYEQVKDPCVFSAGVPTNMPCISVAPHKLPDKDIQATFYLASNRVSRGY
jgi:hypothetical protein